MISCGFLPIRIATRRLKSPTLSEARQGTLEVVPRRSLILTIIMGPDGGRGVEVDLGGLVLGAVVVVIAALDAVWGRAVVVLVVLGEVVECETAAELPNFAAMSASTFEGAAVAPFCVCGNDALGPNFAAISSSCAGWGGGAVSAPAISSSSRRRRLRSRLDERSR